MENNDKFLPNFLTLLCYISFILFLCLFIASGVMRSITNQSTLSLFMNEVNILEIPIEDLVNTKVLGKDYTNKGNVADVITFLSNKYNVDQDIVKNIFLDERVSNQIKYELSYKLKNNLYNNRIPEITENRENMIAKIINKQELINNITINVKLKNQITTILKSYINDVCNISLLNEPNNLILILCSIYTYVIAIGGCYLSFFFLYLIKKDWKKVIDSLAIISISCATFILTYSLIQKGLVFIFQNYYDDYSYFANSFSNSMFAGMLKYSLFAILSPITWFIMTKQEKKIVQKTVAIVNEQVSIQKQIIRKKKRKKIDGFKGIIINLKYRVLDFVNSEFMINAKNKIVDIALINVKFPDFRPWWTFLKRELTKKLKKEKRLLLKTRKILNIKLKKFRVKIENNIFDFLTNEKNNNFKKKIKTTYSNIAVKVNPKINSINAKANKLFNTEIDIKKRKIKI